MNNFDASAHANQIRGNDGTSRFVTQQRHESGSKLLKRDWDFSNHERFEDRFGNLVRMVHYVDDKVTDGPDGAPAVVKFEDSGGRTEKRYRDGVLHDGSGPYPSIARFRADGSQFSEERGYYKDTGHNRKFVPHDSSDGQPGSVKTWEDRRQISRMQHGVRVSLDPTKPAHTVIKLDGSRQEDFHDNYGQRQDPAPGMPAVIGYHPNGSISYTGHYDRGIALNGPRGVHQEVFAEDGTLKSTHEVVYEDLERYGYREPEYRSNYYSSPRPADEMLNGKLTDPEILDRIDENNQVTVRVKVPLAKQKSDSYLLAAGIYQSGFKQVSVALAPIKRNRTTFDVVLDATEIVERWAGPDLFGEGVSNPYWTARLAEKRSE